MLKHLLVGHKCKLRERIQLPRNPFVMLGKWSLLSIIYVSNFSVYTLYYRKTIRFSLSRGHIKALLRQFGYTLLHMRMHTGPIGVSSERAT